MTWLAKVLSVLTIGLLGVYFISLAVDIRFALILGLVTVVLAFVCQILIDYKGE